MVIILGLVLVLILAGPSQAQMYSKCVDAAGKIYDARIFKRLGGYLRPYLKQLAIVLVVGVIVAALHITGPLIVRYAIDNQISEGRDDKLGRLVLAFMGVLLASFALDALVAVVMTYVSQRASTSLATCRRCRLPSSTATRSAACSHV